MIPIDLLTAVILITAPEIPSPAPACSLDTMQAVAVSMELMDTRERAWVFRSPGCWEWDVRLIRERYADLVDAPPVWDALRFPCRDVCGEMIDFNVRYRQFLDDRRILFPADAWQFDEAIGECCRLYEIWDAAHDASCDYLFVGGRRQALKRLRELIGVQAYYNGCMPPHVPIWRFQRIGE